ncbi:uncharacterized protein TRAVEDRAFT_157075 [Trametes versicolor FP-101664 SS1]|uniref:Thioesterase domain-containing protein n=1 Tax=Trametes versicolor (strain FP-101664) TaxID=717944 RepID=R7SA95_TRAVS|nr:uncharacterized protein TRAVEDRAFT_157075 [Trametes versicolor FP-101664 SS1]EIW51889.1 hypothetical protein TRAVEDRAFT_157075 [Trametes versicolor FP-101664 SS1]
MSSQRDPSAVRFEGDLSHTQRSSILKFANIILRGKGLYAKSTGSRLEITEVSFYEREEDKKPQVRMIFELDVDEDMLNSANMVHGGCSMFLIDVCSSIALVSLGIATNRDTRLVSQAITTVFHAPATTGAKLRIINTTVSFGARTVTARTEIWDTTNRRLVASGVHNQMQPSAPKL